jgi:hypothetical protein
MEVVNQMRVRLFIFLVLFAFAFAPSSLFAQANCNPQPCPTPGIGSTKFEISPYGGYVWIGSNDQVGNFKNNQIWGVRGGGYITPSFELGGNYSWNNRFQPSSSNLPSAFAGDLGFPQGAIHSNLWEMEFTYNFGGRSLLGSTALRPYLVAGGGGITASVEDDGVFVLNTRSFFVPGATPAGLQNNLQNNNLQNVLPGINTTDGVTFVGTPTGTTVFVANDVIDKSRTFFTFSYGGGVKAQRLWGPMGIFGDFRGRTISNFFNGHSMTYPEVSAGLNFSWGEK